ncbi:MAG: hypothetical protein SFU98_07785 [Leptospiraceae bacterium]|nr:hypothetical protein [Leptospiraceae bacterium]
MFNYSQDTRVVISFITIAITLYGFVPFIRGIHRNEIKPHAFSWIVWAMTTLITFTVQLAAKGGAGAIPMGISGSITSYIAVISYIKRTDLSIKKIDWLFLILCLGSIPFWYLTSDPFGAVAILTLVDLLGFGPTIRKCYEEPFQESIHFYSVFTVRNLLTIPALEDKNPTTVLFPLAVGLACLGLVLILIYRRRILTQK